MDLCPREFAITATAVIHALQGCSATATQVWILSSQVGQGMQWILEGLSAPLQLWLCDGGTAPRSHDTELLNYMSTALIVYVSHS